MESVCDVFTRLVESRPPKDMIEKAVKAAQMYHSSSRLPIRVQDKLYKRMLSAVDRINHWANSNGYSGFNAYDQIQDEAKKRGPVSPMPGKDY